MAGFCFACMTLFLKLSGDISSFEKSFFRNLVAIFFAFAILKKQHVPLSAGNKSNYKYLIARSFLGTLGIFCNFYAVDHLVIADANMLNKLSPFFAIIFSFFLLKEKIKPHQIACVLIAFCGALLICKLSGGQTLTTFLGFIGLLLGGIKRRVCLHQRTSRIKTRGTRTVYRVILFGLLLCNVHSL